MSNRRPTWRDIVSPSVLGIISLTIVMRRPRFATIQNVDALELIAAGVMFGLAVRAFAMWMHIKTKEGIGLKRLNVNISEQLHRRFKSLAAANGLEMTDLILEWIQKYVDQNGLIARKKGRHA
jgi:hypothetical protein